MRLNLLQRICLERNVLNIMKFIEEDGLIFDKNGVQNVATCLDVLDFYFLLNIFLFDSVTIK